MMQFAPRSSSNVTYAVELYFDDDLDSNLLNARQNLVSNMYNYYNPNHHTPQKFLTMTEPEIHSRPCITLFTTSNPSSTQDHDLAHNLCTLVTNFFNDETSSRVHGLVLPVSLDLETATMFDQGDDNYMFLSVLDYIGKVKDIRESLCSEMALKGFDVKGNYHEKGWVPAVQVAKQTWKQYYGHRAHDEKCWKEFCEENDYQLDGIVTKVAIVQASPTRVLWKILPLL